MKARVLVVDDDQHIRDFSSMVLTQSGYEVLGAADAASGWAEFEASRPDLILLDVGLGPGSADGLELCREIRSVSAVPIVIVTSRGEEADELLGLFVGADDYLIKPVAPKLLVARVAAQLRRASSGVKSGSPQLLQFGGIALDLQSRTAAVHGQLVSLSGIEFELLLGLAEHQGRVVKREELQERVWGDWYGDDRHLDVHLSRLRAKISDAGGPRVAPAVGLGFKLFE